MRVLRSCDRGHSRGQILIIVALIMVLILSLVGAGVDYGLILVEDTRTQHAADAAALAASRALVGASTPGIPAAQSTATEYLRLHGYQNGVANTTISYAWATPAPSGPIDRATIDITRTHPTLFWNVIGINQVQIRGQSTARGTGGGMPDVLVSLDQVNMSTGDMAQQRSALNAFVAQLQPSTTQPRSPRIGLARYRGQVCASGDGVWAWGGNSSGQLGRGTVSLAESNPLAVATDTVVSVIAAGGSHSLGWTTRIGATGSPDIAWGANTLGQLGDNDAPNDSSVPVAVLGAMSNIVALAAGGRHSLALRSDGLIYSWGENLTGQLGRSTGLNPGDDFPGPIPLFTNVVAIAAGGSHSLALASDGTVWAWGDNSSGQLGDGTIGGFSLIPVPVLSVGAWSPNNTIAAIAAGESHSMALASNDRVWTWGANDFGQLGIGGPSLPQASPQFVTVGRDVDAIAAGDNHSLALGSNERVYAWGLNSTGQVGEPTLTNQDAPFLVPGVDSVNAIAAGGSHSLALRRNATVWAWGANDRRQLGAGAGVLPLSTTPVQVTGLPAICAISAGGTHNLAMESSAFARDAHVLAQLTSDRSLLQQAISGPASGCPALPVQPPNTTPPLGSTQYMCALKTVGGARRYIKAGLEVGFLPSTWNLWEVAKGGRADAKKILVLLAGGRNRSGGGNPPESTMNSLTIAAADALKPGADGVLNSPVALPDDVEVYVVGFLGGSESGLTGATPPGCPSSTLPGGRKAFDDMLIAVSSSTSGSCDHYYPLRKSSDLSQVFTAIAIRIARSALLN